MDLTVLRGSEYAMPKSLSYTTKTEILIWNPYMASTFLGSLFGILILNPYHKALRLEILIWNPYFG